MRRSLLPLLLTLTIHSPGLAHVDEIVHAATCTGATPCNACKNCNYCKHCATNGGKCGVCRRGALTNSAG